MLNLFQHLELHTLALIEILKLIQDDMLLAKIFINLILSLATAHSVILTLITYHCNINTCG